LNTDRQVVIGKISGVYGVRGWCRVFSYTDPRDGILQYSPWTLRSANGEQSVKLTEGRKQGKGVVVKLEGCDDRDAALALMDSDILIERDQLPDIGSDEYYWIDLVGLRVLSVKGDDFGTVESVFATGANDVLVVKGERERLIPFVQPDVVTDIDLQAGIMRVDWDSDF
jgi:16S rRNA processing protein RimM